MFFRHDLYGIHTVEPKTKNKLETLLIELYFFLITKMNWENSIEKN